MAVFRCVECRKGSTDLQSVLSGWQCSHCSRSYRAERGVVDAMRNDRREHFGQFHSEYLTIRHAEGRGSPDPEYYLALPERDLTDRLDEQWKMRARTFQCFQKKVLSDAIGEARRPLEVLDLGAGVGWLSYRLALQGHRPVAVDLLDDELDGLGAAMHYEAELGRRLPAFRAEFGELPFGEEQFDLAIFNASFHYGADYAAVLREVRRVLKWNGRVVILDTPVYAHWSHGERMREERHQDFEQRFGFRSDSILSMEYLDEDMISDLAKRLNLTWRIWKPWYGWSWHLRPWKARLAGRRPPSRFWILEGRWANQ